MTHTELRAMLHYDPSTGVWTWLQGRRAGQQAGCVQLNGYITIRINQKLYYAHRLAWFYMGGSWPRAQIDHRNRQRADNRWCNLREATQSTQEINKGLTRRNHSGIRGVWQRADTQRWTAQIEKDGRKYSLGCFDTAEEATAAYLQAARVHHHPTVAA